MRKASVLLTVLFVTVLDYSPALAQLDFNIPAQWWTRSRDEFPDWPQGFDVEDAIVDHIADGAERIVFAGPRYIIAAESVFINHNLKDQDSADFDGRLLSAEEFADRIKAGAAPERITVWYVPTIDGKRVVQEVKYGGNYEYSPFKDEIEFGGLGQDEQGRSYIQAMGGSIELAGEVGDENGTPIFDLFGAVLQEDKVPQPGERVRYLKFYSDHSLLIVRLVRNAQPWSNAQSIYVHQDRKVVAEVEANGRAVRLRGPDIRVAEHTEFFDAAGVAFGLQDIDEKIAPGSEIRVAGEWERDVVFAAYVDVDQTHNQPFDRPLWHFIYAGRSADGSLQTVDNEYIRVALEASISDAASGANMTLDSLEPGTPIELERRWCNAAYYWSTEDLSYGRVCGAITAIALNAFEPGEIQIYHEWVNNGLVARIDDGGFGPELVTRGPVVQIDGDTQIENAEGLTLDLEDLQRGQQVFVDLLPTRDPTVALARSVQVWESQYYYQSSFSTYQGTIDGIEGDLVYLEGSRYALADGIEVLDEHENAVAADQLAAGQYVQMHVQSTSVGERLQRIQALDSDPYFQPFREEEAQFFGIDVDGRVILAGSRATIVPRPEGSTRGTEILDGNGLPMTLEALRDLADLSELRVVLTSRTSLSSGEEIALRVRIFNHDIPLEEQMSEGSELGDVGAIDGDEIQLVERHRSIHLARDAEIIWHGDSVAAADIPPLAAVRLYIVEAPSGFPQFFGHIVTQIDVDPQAVGPQPHASLTDFDGIAQVIDRSANSLVMEGEQFRVDPFLTTIVDDEFRRLEMAEVPSGALLSIHFVAGTPPLATRILVLDPQARVRSAEDIILGFFAGYDAPRRRLALQGPTFDLAQTVQVQDAAGQAMHFANLLAGDHLMLGLEGETVHQIHLVAQTVEQEEESVLLGTLRGAVQVAGDEVSRASVFVYDPAQDGVEAIAGAAVDASGAYEIGDIPPGQYTAYVEIETVGGRNLLLFFDRDGNGQQDVFEVVAGEVGGIDFLAQVLVEPEHTNDRAGFAVTLDLDPRAGDQALSQREIEAGDTIEMAVYAHGAVALAGFSASVRFDTLQLTLAEVEDGTAGEVNFLRSQPGAIALFLPARRQQESVEFGGAILSPTTVTAATGDGLLGVLHFTARPNYTGAHLNLEHIIVKNLDGSQETLAPAATALVTLSQEAVGKGQFSFDFNAAVGDDDMGHLQEMGPGQEIAVAVYVNEVEALTNYSVKLNYDPAQLSYVDFAENGADEPNFLGVAGGTAFFLPPLLTEDTVEFGGAILGAEAAGSPTGNGLVGVLRFVTTENFSGTDLLISSHSLRSFGGEQEDVDAAILAHISAVDDVGMEGDFDGDGQVGFSDFFSFADAFGQPDFDSRFDLDNDGQVGFGDFFRFADAFGQGVAKAVVAEVLPQVDGQLLLAAQSVDGEVVVDLYSADLQINGYATVVQYDAAAFELVEVSDDVSVLTTPLLLTREGHGEVLIAGSATGNAESVEGVLAQLRFVSTTEDASGLFRMRQATVRQADGGQAEVRELGQAEIRPQPLAFALHANYPNPFNPSTTIPFQLAEMVEVELAVYDVLGQKIRTLAEGVRSAGQHQVTWDGRDAAGMQVAGGMYFYRLETGSFSRTHKLLLVK